MTRRLTSPGWGETVILGDGQAHIYARLERAVRHPSRAWNDAPRLRAFDRSPGTAHRALQRLAALGVIALQSTLGRTGSVRFTFGVRRWKWTPASRRQVARMVRAGIVAPGQTVLALLPAAPDPPRPVSQPVPERNAPGPRFPPCVLCGSTERVRIGLTRFEELTLGFTAMTYGSGMRCLDHEACRERGLLRGNAQTLDDVRAFLGDEAGT